MTNLAAGHIELTFPDDQGETRITFVNELREVPEPATIGLLGLGFGVLMLRRRRR